jgi:hypothetical protein
MKHTAGIILSIAMMIAIGSADSTDWRPEWRMLCFNSTTGAYVENASASGYCPHNCCNQDETCRLIDRVSVCVPIKFKTEGLRCTALARGEVERHPAGISNVLSAVQFTCFNKTSGRVNPKKKPDGFCETNATASGPVCMGHECDEDEGAQCTWFLDVCMCQRTNAPDDSEDECLAITAAELSGRVRGWPPAFF